jgi:hypothetical protein
MVLLLAARPLRPFPRAPLRSYGRGRVTCGRSVVESQEPLERSARHASTQVTLALNQRHAISGEFGTPASTLLVTQRSQAQIQGVSPVDRRHHRRP